MHYSDESPEKNILVWIFLYIESKSYLLNMEFSLKSFFLFLKGILILSIVTH